MTRLSIITPTHCIMPHIIIRPILSRSSKIDLGTMQRFDFCKKNFPMWFEFKEYTYEYILALIAKSDK